MTRSACSNPCLAGFPDRMKGISGLIALPVINAFKARIDPRRYNGASLLGLQGIVIKSHGSADSFSFQRAIEIAILEVTKDVPNRIDNQLETLLAHP